MPFQCELESNDHIILLPQNICSRDPALQLRGVQSARCSVLLWAACSLCIRAYYINMYNGTTFTYVRIQKLDHTETYNDSPDVQRLQAE